MLGRPRFLRKERIQKLFSARSFTVFKAFSVDLPTEKTQLYPSDEKD
jgi:hypothetical protein